MTSIVIILIAANVILSLVGFYSPGFFQRFAFSPQAIRDKGQVDRILLSTFLHADWGHLLFNMFSFYSFGTGIEEVVGPWVLLVIYFMSSVGGDLLAYFVHHRHPGYMSVGASGAIAGVIFASVLIYPGGDIIIFPLPIPIPSWAYAFLFIAISVYGIGRQSDTIGHEAHLGGALTGLLVTVVLYPSLILRHPVLFFGITAAAVAFLIYLLMNQDKIHRAYRRHRD